MTPNLRIGGLIRAVRHLTAAEVPGAFVECGVWKGGSMMAAALTLLDEQTTDRGLWLYDTFQGMTAPADIDRDRHGRSAAEILEGEPPNSWLLGIAPEAEVRANMASTGYPTDRVRFVAGSVIDTIPTEVPDEIALLRLDTDWYDSTAHELKYLYPRLAPGGILIVDDYGHWSGSRQAVDEYNDALDRRLLLLPLDYSAVIAVKP